MALRPTYPFYLANRAHQPNADLLVTDKYSGGVATRVAQANAADEDMSELRLLVIRDEKR